jgi:hypothetical protein
MRHQRTTSLGAGFFDNASRQGDPDEQRSWYLQRDARDHDGDAAFE